MERHFNVANEQFFKDNQAFQDRLSKLPLRNRSALSHFKVFLAMPPSMRDRCAVCMTEIRAPGGESFAHVWLELGDKVIDKTTNQNVFDKAFYYKMSGITPRQVTRYDKKSAEIFIKRMSMETLTTRRF